LTKPHRKTDQKLPTPPADQSRRAFLVWSGGLASGVLASYIANHIPILSWEKLKSRFSSTSQGIDLLFAPGSDERAIKFHHGMAHYLTGSAHPDNVSTGDELAAAISAATGTELRDDPARYTLEAASDWVLIGAPSSNEISKILLSNSSVRLRYVYEYSDSLVLLSRFTAAGEPQAHARQSSIRDLANSNIYRPAEGHDQVDDYLLITRLAPLESAGARTVIGGTHGIGTRATLALLNDLPLSNRQIWELQHGRHTGFQLLAKVDVKQAPHETRVENVTVLDVVSL